MAKIYLIRHAEAEGNYYRRIQGWYDGAITARGRLQIEALARRFRDIDINALYSSDLRRTMETARAILKHHKLTLNTDPRLREVDMGSWEDQPWGNVCYDTPEQLLFFSNDPEKWSIPGGEDYLHLQQRVNDAVCDIAQRHEGQTVAVFSHGAAIRSLICKLKGISSCNISEIPHGDNTCVALLEYEKGSLRLGYYNDNSHLSDTTSTFAGQSWWKNAKETIDTANLRIVPMNPAEDGQLYMDCYTESWKNAHGDLSGFNPTTYLKNAERAAAVNPQCLIKSYVSGTCFAGILELDPRRMASSGAGWISFFYLLPEHRGKGFAPQLLGHAVSFFRSAGRSRLCLHVAQTNKRAIQFYEREGFTKAGTEQGISDTLLLMEMAI